MEDIGRESTAMARLARIAVPSLPYHVTQRGNRRQAVFLRPEDYRYYLALLQEESTRELAVPKTTRINPESIVRGDDVEGR